MEIKNQRYDLGRHQWVQEVMRPSVLKLLMFYYAAASPNGSIDINNIGSPCSMWWEAKPTRHNLVRAAAVQPKATKAQ